MELMDIRRGLLMQMAGRITLIERGEYTPAENIASSQVSIQHSLGVAPDFIYVMTENMDTSAGAGNRHIVWSFCGRKDTIGQTYTAYACYYTTNNSGGVYSNSEGINYTKFSTDTTFKIPYYNTSDTLKSGIKYRYIIGRLSEE